jgi:triacylglycerol lipase
MIEPLRHTPLLPGTLQNLYFPPSDYTYFARAKECPFSAGRSIVRAAWAADASMLAYARYGQRHMTDAELDANFQRAGLTYEKIGDWDAPGTQGVFAFCDAFAILAFRGTEADDPKDCFYDADLVLVHEPDYRPAADDHGPALGFLANVEHLFSPPCLVHRGFQMALNSVWEQVHGLVTNYRKGHPGVEICFTGHSLGGALAVLAFSRFADPDLSLFTFGCPRVGDGPFRDRVLSNPGRGICRYVNYNDAVAHIPLESLLYRQSPLPCYRFDENGVLGQDDDSFKGDVAALRTAVIGLPASIRLGDLDQIPAPPSVVDHSPARYCFRLWDCV